MNRAAASFILAIATAAGFAAGWFPDDRSPGAPTQRVEKSAASGPVAPVTPLPALLPAFRELRTAAECQEFLAEAPRRYGGSHPLAIRAIKDYALRRWLELDAESALQEAERHPGNEFSTEGFAPDLFRVWLDLNVDSAISAFNQANPILAKNVRVAFLTTLAEKDPARAVDLKRTARGSGSDLWDEADQAIFSRWARVDPQRALSEARNPGQRLAVVKELAVTNPSFALTTVLCSDSGGYLLLHSGLLPYALAGNPAMASQALASASPGDLHAAAESWVAQDSTAALEWAQSQPAGSEFARRLQLSAARRYTLSDPEQAIRLLANTKPPAESATSSGKDEEDSRARVMSEAFSSLAASSPERALEMLRNDPAAARDGGMAGYFAYAFGTDTAAAVERFKEWAADPALKEAVLEAAVQALEESREAGTHDPRTLLTALPELVEKAGPQILGAWAAANPAAASDFILEQATAGKAPPGLASSEVLTQLAISQPKYTSLWLQRVPDAGLQQTTAALLAANWNSFDPEATAAWINSLPDGPLREAALSGYDRSRRTTKGSGEMPVQP